MQSDMPFLVVETGAQVRMPKKVSALEMRDGRVGKHCPPPQKIGPAELNVYAKAYAALFDKYLCHPFAGQRRGVVRLTADGKHPGSFRAGMQCSFSRRVMQEKSRIVMLSGKEDRGRRSSAGGVHDIRQTLLIVYYDDNQS